MRISAFCLTTNSLKNQYPVIESIKSFLPVVDELIVIDGGSIDGTIEAIQAIGDSKIRIVNDEDTKWEEDWFYSRMSHNFNRGYEECTGDIVLKFDVDYLFHESRYPGQKEDFKKACQKAIEQDKPIIRAVRYNFILADRYFVKKDIMMGVNRNACEKKKLVIKWGLDTSRWAWGNIPIIYKYTENGTNFGMMFSTCDMFSSNALVYNYGFTFSDYETVKRLRYENFRALLKQQNLRYKTSVSSKLGIEADNINDIYVMNLKKEETIGNFKRRQQAIKLEDHPILIQERIKNMTPGMFGYSAFDWVGQRAEYFK